MAAETVFALGKTIQRYLVHPLNHKAKAKLGHRLKSGGATFSTYVFLIGLGFCFLYPLLFMFCKSFFTMHDLQDATVSWIPRQIQLGNYDMVVNAMDYFGALWMTLLVSGGCAVLQSVGCAVAGYGLARYRVPGGGVIFALVLLAILIPPPAVIVPLKIMFGRLGWADSSNPVLMMLPFYVPALLGHGLRGALFVIVYRQFFMGLPWQLEESARIDGASGWRIFTKIGFPLAQASSLVVFLFSFVWHWNDSFEQAIYLPATVRTLPNLLEAIPSLLNKYLQGALMFGTGSQSALASIIPQISAATLLVILPVLLLYSFAQRYFIEGVERAGITGE